MDDKVLLRIDSLLKHIDLVLNDTNGVDISKLEEGNVLFRPVSVKPEQKPEEKKATSPLSTIKPVTYFNLEDDGVPFLLETPTQPTK